MKSGRIIDELELISGKSFGFDKEKWESWWNIIGKKWKIPAFYYNELSNAYETGKDRTDYITTPEGIVDYDYFCGSRPDSVTKGSESVSYGYGNRNQNWFPTMLRTTSGVPWI